MIVNCDTRVLYLKKYWEPKKPNAVVTFHSLQQDPMISLMNANIITRKGKYNTKANIFEL